MTMARVTVGDAEDREVWLVRMPADMNPEVLKAALPKLKLKRRAAGEEMQRVSSADGEVYAIRNGSTAEAEGVRCALPTADAHEGGDGEEPRLSLLSRPCDRVITVTAVVGRAEEDGSREKNGERAPPSSFRHPYHAPRQRSNLRAVFRPVGSTVDLRTLNGGGGAARGKGQRKRRLSEGDAPAGKKAKLAKKAKKRKQKAAAS